MLSPQKKNRLSLPFLGKNKVATLQVHVIILLVQQYQKTNFDKNQVSKSMNMYCTYIEKGGGGTVLDPLVYCQSEAGLKFSILSE